MVHQQKGQVEGPALSVGNYNSLPDDGYLDITRIGFDLASAAGGELRDVDLSRVRRGEYDLVGEEAPLDVARIGFDGGLACIASLKLHVARIGLDAECARCDRAREGAFLYSWITLSASDLILFRRSLSMVFALYALFAPSIIFLR